MAEIEGSVGGKYIVIERSGTVSKTGTIFIEARVRDDAYGWESSLIKQTLEKHLSSTDTSFELGKDILADEYKAKLILSNYYEDAQYSLESLKVVEYAGPKTNLTCFSSEDVKISIHVYQLNTEKKEENEGVTQAEVSIMPHADFDGRWDELVLEANLKDNLIWMMTNILRFSRQSLKVGDINPLILLHGPPGTGKTTLAQGLAQKISIRLNTVYKQTKLVQIKTATLLSKYYSESAKQVDEIFRTIENMCQENEDEFVCVLIDEVESIANCRQSSARNGEAQDSMRATNALLTGLDRAKNYSNVIFLCTSNMVGSLDAAFLDRCCLKLAVDSPSSDSQYTILRSRVQKLISRGIIVSDITLPSYWDAVIDFDNKDLPGSKLLRIVHLINADDSESKPEGRISGRRLTQLPELALLLQLRGEECDLDMALGFIESFVLDGQNEQRRQEAKMNTWEEKPASEDGWAGLGVQGRKRNLNVSLEGDCDPHAGQPMMRQLTLLHEQQEKRRRQENPEPVLPRSEQRALLHDDEQKRRRKGNSALDFA